MTNQQENREFDNAANAAGIRGTDWKNDSALDNFSEYFHNTYDKWERDRFSFGEIKEIAEAWWSVNRDKYIQL